MSSSSVIGGSDFGWANNVWLCAGSTGKSVNSLKKRPSMTSNSLPSRPNVGAWVAMLIALRPFRCYTNKLSC